VNDKDQEKYVRASLRHVEALREAGPGASKSETPFPRDWFDLPQSAFADLGAMLYLAGLSKFYRTRPLPKAVSQFEVPLRLKQYHIFRSGGFPRAFMTWAALTDEAEHRFAIKHEAIRPEDWNAGASMWIMDLVAPFGHIEQIIPRLSDNQDLLRLRTLWHNKTGTRYRVLEWRRREKGGEVAFSTYGVRQFEKMLSKG